MNLVPICGQVYNFLTIRDFVPVRDEGKDFLNEANQNENAMMI